MGFMHFIQTGYELNVSDHNKNNLPISVMYLLVQFVPDNSVGVALDSWLDDDSPDEEGLYTVAYPPSKLLRRLLMKKADPSPLWESYKCCILYRNGKKSVCYDTSIIQLYLQMQA